MSPLTTTAEPPHIHFFALVFLAMYQNLQISCKEEAFLHVLFAEVTELFGGLVVLLGCFFFTILALHHCDIKGWVGRGELSGETNTLFSTSDLCHRQTHNVLLIPLLC